MLRKLLENDFLLILAAWLKQAIELCSSSSSKTIDTSLISTLEYLFSILIALPTESNDLSRIASSKIGHLIRDIHKTETLFAEHPDLRKNATNIFHRWTAANTANKQKPSTSSSSSSTTTKPETKDKKEDITNINHTSVPTTVINLALAKEAAKSLNASKVAIGLPTLSTRTTNISSSTATTTTSTISSSTLPDTTALAPLPSLSAKPSTTNTKRSTKDIDSSDSDNDNDIHKHKKSRKESKDKDAKHDKRKDRDDKESNKKDKDSKRSRKETTPTMDNSKYKLNINCLLL